MRNPIRVAFFIDDVGLGGTQRWLTLLVDALATRGFEMRVYSMRAISDPENVRRLSKHASVEIIGEGRLWAGVGLAYLLQQLKSWPAQVVQTALPTADMVGRTLAHLARVPAVFSSVRGRALDKPIWQRWLDRRTVHWARRVVFNNREIIPHAMRYAGVGKDQIVYIPNGVALRPPQGSAEDVRRELTTPLQVPIVATIARLHASKHQEALLHALALVHRTYPDAVLWIVGEGERRPAIEREARRLGISAHLRLPGVRYDVSEILQAIDVFALPSRWEGMPNALMEAMAAGKPVVASDIDGIRELISHGETGWRVPPGNVDVLAQTMLEILSNRERAAQVGRAASMHMQRNFSIDRMADAYAQLYRDSLRLGV